ncbi:MAG: ABC transporter substrate-binding protein [Thermoguttaceae bacterium]
MRVHAVFFAAILFAAVARAQTTPPDPPPLPGLSPQMEDVLKAINALGPYQAPDLPLKTDQNYAHIPDRYRPFGQFGGVKPFKEHFREQIEYTGPGRSIPEPEEVKTVKIGFIGPIYPTVSVATGGRSHEETLGIKMAQGCQLAIDEANARGGYLKRKIPFELVVHNDSALWGASGNEIINMRYNDQCWAILGSVDGANSHIALRVALKAEILIMNTADTDPTYIETNIPWTCRVIGDDRQMGYLLADYLYDKLKIDRIGIIRASNRYGRFGVRQVRDSSRRRGHPVPVEMAYQVGGDDFALHLDRLKRAGVKGVVHWGDAADGAHILNQMRAMGMQQPFFCCDRCLSDEFLKIAGKNAEGVVCGSPWDPTRSDEKLHRFREAFRQRYPKSDGPAPLYSATDPDPSARWRRLLASGGPEVETYAAHGYDGMNMVIWAVQAAGLNRAKIRDMIAYRTEPWPGVTGDILFSSVLDDIGDVYLAKRENSAWKYFSREMLGLSPQEPREKDRPR